MTSTDEEMNDGAVVATNTYAKDKEAAGSKSPNAVTAMTDANSSSGGAVVFTPELLKVYYSRLFPFALMYQWLSYDPKQQIPATTLKAAPTTTTTSSQTATTTTSTNTVTTTATTTAASRRSTTSTLFHHREFSFTLQTPSKDEIYLRYQCFKTMEEWQQAMVQKNPIKFDLGAIYSHAPSNKNSMTTSTSSSGGAASSFQPVQRELVLDIDVSDYDDIRHCGCTGASQICTTCWHYLDMSQDILDQTLRQDFGFQHIAWFYSGRRGIHAWICDTRARELNNAARSALANYLEVHLGSERNQDVHLKTPLHPMLKRAVEVLEPYFVDYVVPAKGGHGLLATPERWNKDVLDMLPPSAQLVKDKLSRDWDKPNDLSTPKEKWADLKQHLKSIVKVETGKTKNKTKKSKTMEESDKQAVELWPTEMILKQTYPRLDVNVTKMQNHLLKSPFCVHPKTGRVCVYIPQNKDQKKKGGKKSRMSFDPFSVPTLAQVIQELDEYHQKESQASGKDDDDDVDVASKTPPETLRYDWQKTSLRPYMEAFEKEFLQPLLKDLRQEQRQAQDREEAQRGDF